MKRILTVLALTGALAIPVFAEHLSGLPLSEVVARAKQAEEGVTSFSCRFTERIHRRDMPDESIRGTLSYEHPRRVRVDQRAPDKQVIVSDGSKVRVYTPAAHQVIVGDWKKWVNDSGFPAPLLSFIGELPADQWEQRYTILFGGYDDGAYQLLFRPKKPEDSTLSVWLSDETFLPERGRISEKDLSIDVKFDDLRVNAPIAAETFHPSIPKDTVEVPLPS